MRRVPALIGLFAMVAAPAVAAMKKGQQVFDDVIIFDGGCVSMRGCVERGSKASRYSTIRADGALWFMTERTSEKRAGHFGRPASPATPSRGR